MKETFQENIRVNASAEHVFAVWDDVHLLKQIVQTIEHVERKDEEVTRWMLHAPFNLRIAYTARITSKVANDHIAWVSEHDAQTQGGHQGPVSNSGRVEFKSVDDGRATEVSVSVTYTLPGKKAHQVVSTLNALGYPTREIRRALEDIRDYIQGQVQTQASAA